MFELRGVDGAEYSSFYLNFYVCEISCCRMIGLFVLLLVCYLYLY